MSIKPVDYQIMINQSNEISKVKHVQNDKNRTDQQQFLQQFVNKVEQNLHQTPDLKESSESKINKDKKQDKQYKKEERDKKKDNMKEKKQMDNDIHLIDIKV